MSAISDPRDIYSVTRLNREVHALLQGSFPPIWLQGELSNFAYPASGHMYLSLKDIHSQVRCAMFKHKNRCLDFVPRNGDEVIVRANVGLYEGRGEFQLIIEHMQLAGEGALWRTYEALKQKLFEEGLFDEVHKNLVPVIPATIGVITSSAGAAIQDILNVLGRRYPAGTVIVYPVPVQGSSSAEKIITMLETVEKRNECDVIILARGGGSMEDLWAFNNETLARKIFACAIPIVSGIGHEIDFTIADFVADRRAPTPSAAAELVSPDQMHMQHILSLRQNQLTQMIQDCLETFRKNILHLEKCLPHPLTQLQNNAQRLDLLSVRVNGAMCSILARKNRLLYERTSIFQQYSPLQKLRFFMERTQQIYQRLQQATIYHYQHFHAQTQTVARALNAVNPLATLSRGYAVVTTPSTQEIIRTAKQLTVADEIWVRFSQDQAKCTVNEILEGSLAPDEP